MTPEKKAMVFASITAVFLIILKSVAGVFTGSMAILTSAIDSTLDFFVSLMNFFAIRKSEQPDDEIHNYGHGKIEGFGAIFEGLIIFFSGLFVIYFSMERILKNQIISNTNESIFVMIIAIIVTFCLVIYLKKVATQTGSLVIKTDLLHYKTDLYTNFGIIISLIAIRIFELPIIDPVISIGIAIYIIYGSIQILSEGYNMLMDKSLEKNIVDFIKNTVLDHDEIDSFHFLKTRKSGKNSFIEFHIVFKKVDILLKDAHNISDDIESKIIEKVPNSTVMIHLDYFDDSHDKNNPKLKK